MGIFFVQKVRVNSVYVRLSLWAIELLNVSMFVYVLLPMRTFIRMFANVLACIFTQTYVCARKQEHKRKDTSIQ